MKSSRTTLHQLRCNLCASKVQVRCNFCPVLFGNFSWRVDLRFCLSQLDEESALDFSRFSCFFQTDKFFGLPFFNERVYMLNVQKHLPKYNQHFCILLIIREVWYLNFYECRTHCWRTDQNELIKYLVCIANFIRFAIQTCFINIT